MIRVSAIVEGHGEESSMRVLLPRIFAQYLPHASVKVIKPFRVHRHQIIRRLQNGAFVVGDQELQRKLQLARINIERRGLILLLLDADDDCPRELAEELSRHCRPTSPDEIILLCVANREYESWFVAARESLVQAGKLERNWDAGLDAESVRGAKEWIGNRIPAGNGYRETVDQPSFSALFDLEEARQARSFDRLCTRLIAAVDTLHERSLDSSS